MFENFFNDFFTHIGENKSRVELLNTHNRVVKSWKNIYSGYKKNPLELFNNTFHNNNYDEIVVLKNIEFYSMCEHHILPFFGRASIGYIPNDKLIGVSKLVELVDIFAKRLQVQERLTNNIADTLFDNLKPKGVMIIIEATHLCMIMQGMEKHSSILITNAIRGIFKKDHNKRAEFLKYIK